MDDLARLAVADDLATITLDDGKVNALSPSMSAAVVARIDEAIGDESVRAVILTGRATTFSAGFDLRVAPEHWGGMLAAGAGLAERLLTCPKPTVIACNGNAIAMGAFLLLAADLRIGAEGPFRLGLNEVAIGLTMPWFGLALARHRLTAPAFDRCAVTGGLLDPAAATADGFLDRTTAPEQLVAEARAAAAELAKVDPTAHARTKLRVREPLLVELRAATERLTGPAEDW